MIENAPVAISLFGQFAVSGPDGADLTPRSQKACAIIALICESAELRCSRAALQDKLWSDREQAQGAISLRQALSDIRRAFKDHRDILRADNRMVSLDRDSIEIDIIDSRKVAQAIARGLIYLDGIGVKDPEFDDWLRDKRSEREGADSASDDASAPVPVMSAPFVHREATPNVPVLYLSATTDSGAPLFAEHIVNAVGMGVAETSAVDVRMGFDPAPGGNVYSLEVGERPMGESTALHARLMTVPDGVICWQKSEVLTVSGPNQSSVTLARLINQCIDGTISAFTGVRSFRRLSSDDPSVVQSAAAVQRLWLLAGTNPSALITELQESFDQHGRGIDLAWQAFVVVFAVGERRKSPLEKLDARRLIRRAIELEPNNSLVLALASHVHGFVLREFEVSMDLAERAVRLDRTNVLAWTFLGIAYVNMGDAENGYKAANYARKIASEGPYRAFVDGIAASTACMTNRLDEAVLLGEATHARQPIFAPPLRYLLASYILKEDYGKAQHTLRRLQELEPDFDVRFLSEPEYPVEPLRRSRVIDVRKIPLLR